MLALCHLALILKRAQVGRRAYSLPVCLASTSSPLRTRPPPDLRDALALVKQPERALAPRHAAAWTGITGWAVCAGCLSMLMIAAGARCKGPGSLFVRAGELGADLVGVGMLDVVKYG
jgi:hypothetical protein